MVKINKKVEYALIVLKHFLENPSDNRVTARKICDVYSTPFDTTSKVMQTMNNYGILSSSQGVKGGYKLEKDLSLISYYELAELVEGKKLNPNCDEMKCTLAGSCNITGPIEKLGQYLTYFFKGLSLRELLEESPGPKNLLMGMTSSLNQNQPTEGTIKVITNE